MVINSRSKSGGVNMSITAEVCEYFENPIKPLVSNQSLEVLLCKFKEGTISKFKEFKIHSQENAFKKLEIISDNNEQYRRRSCLRIYGIEFKEGDGGDVLEEIEKCCNVTGIPFNENEIDREHGVGKPSWIRNGKRKLGQQ